MNAHGHNTAIENVFNALVVTFLMGPVLALVGLYTSPALALGAFVVQVTATAIYFLAKDSGPSVTERMRNAAARAKEHKAHHAVPHPAA